MSENGIRFSGATSTELLTLTNDSATLNVSFGLVPSADPRPASFAEWDGVGFLPAGSSIVATPEQFVLSPGNRKQPWVMKGRFSGTMKSKAGESTASGTWTAGPWCPGSNWCGQPALLGPFTLSKLDLPAACPTTVTERYFALDGSGQLQGEVKADGTVTLSGSAVALDCRNEGPAAGDLGPGLSNVGCFGPQLAIDVGGCTYDGTFFLNPGLRVASGGAATLVAIPRSNCATPCVVAFKAP